MFKSPSARRAITAAIACGMASALCLTTAPVNAVQPAPAATTTDAGLFGSADPTYTGVYRESLSLLALIAAGQTPPPVAVSWLLSQQCADGGFQGYKPAGGTCTPTDSNNYVSEDSNTTGMALQALSALQQTSAAQAAADWLVAHQSVDHGFAYYPDNGVNTVSDANSTAIVLMGLNAFNAYAATVPVTAPPTITAHVAEANAGSAFLASLQIVPCPQAPAEWPVSATDGAFAYMFTPTLATPTPQPADFNNYATVQASFALSGHLLTDGPIATGLILPIPVTCTGITPDAYDPAKVSADYLNTWIGGATAPFANDPTDEAGWAALALIGSGLSLPLVGDQPSLDIALAAAHATVANGSTDPGDLAIDILARHAQPGGATDSQISSLVTRLLATLSPVASMAPSMSGAVKVGQVVTCTPGQWTKSPTKFAYTWTVGTSTVARASRLTLRKEWVNKSLRCAVDATNSFGTTTVKTAAARIGVGTLTNLALPTIVGRARVGSYLAATSGNWKPQPTGAKYVWKRGNTIVGTGIGYRVKSADRGKQLVVVVTVTSPGYVGTATSKPRTVR